MIKALLKTLCRFSPINAVVVALLERCSRVHTAKSVRLLAIPEGESITIDMTPITTDPMKMVYQCHGSIDQIAHCSFVQGWASFEKPLPAIIVDLMREGGCFIDVGANTGFYSLLAAMSGQNKVISFEPFPAVYQCLLSNIQLNDQQHAIDVFPIAISDDCAQSELFIPDNDHGLVETSASLNAHFKDSHGDVVSVATKTLDVFCAENGIQGVDVIKIDVESFEKNVLAGAVKVIDKFNPIIILEVLTEEHLAWFRQFLYEQNYTAFSIKERIEENPQLEINPFQPNLIFCPQEKLAQIQRLSAKLTTQ